MKLSGAAAALREGAFGDKMASISLPRVDGTAIHAARNMCLRLLWVALLALLGWNRVVDGAQLRTGILVHGCHLQARSGDLTPGATVPSASSVGKMLRPTLISRARRQGKANTALWTLM
mgnify:CR=1